MYIWIWHSWLNQESRLHYGTATLCSKQLVDCYLKRFGAQDALTQLAWYTYHRLGSLNYLKEFIWVRVWHVVSCHTCSLVSQEAFIQNIPSVLKMPYHLYISESSLSPCIPSGATWLSFFVQKLMIRLPLAMMTQAQVVFFFFPPTPGVQVGMLWGQIFWGLASRDRDLQWLEIGKASRPTLNYPYSVLALYQEIYLVNGGQIKAPKLLGDHPVSLAELFRCMLPPRSFYFCDQIYIFGLYHNLLFLFVGRSRH